MTADRILLRGMRFSGRHGVSESERSLPQPIEVDLDAWLDLRPAGRSDALDRTVDYGELFQRCRAVVEGPPARLLEALAERIADVLLAEFPVDRVRVEVRKLRVPVDGQLGWAAVEIERRRPGPA